MPSWGFYAAGRSNKGGRTMNRMSWVFGLVLVALSLALASCPLEAYAGPVIASYTLTITPPVNGKVTASPAMPNGGYPAGTTVSLMATAYQGFRFSAWTGSNGAEVQPAVLTVLGSGTIVMNGNKTVSAAFTATDTTPPTGTIVINNNRSTTNSATVTLALTWDDGNGGSGVSRMRFSNDGATWTAWEALAATRVWTLFAGDGYKTVRVQYLDRANNRSTAFSDYIRLDTTPPKGSIIINNGAPTTMLRAVTLGLTWSDATTGSSVTGAGVTRMRFSDNGYAWTAWESVAATRPYTLPEGLGYHTVRVQFLDGAGNYSAVYNDYIKLVVPDPHLGVIADDKDGDYLSDAEELALESDPANPDEDLNGVPDGVDLAREMVKAISQMPWFDSAGTPQNGLNPPELAQQFPTDQPYVVRFDYQVDCIWVCPVCHQESAVGELRIVNPAIHTGWSEGFQMPLSAWHFLQHGSFSYSGPGCGAMGEGRLDVPDLVRAVTATTANMKASQWIACGSQPKEWVAEILPLGALINGIRIAGPTAQYGNDCEGNVALGGRPYIAVNADAHTLTLVAVGPVSAACPAVYLPVCGLQTQIIGIAGGKWTFRAPTLDPPIEFSFTI